MKPKLRATVALIAVLIPLTACSTSPVLGGAVQGNPVDSNDAKYAKALGKTYEQFSSAADEHAKIYYHARFNEKKSDQSFETFRQGGGPKMGMFSKSKTGVAGANLDFLHPAGSNSDFVLLGKKFKSVAPTPWVRYDSVVIAYGGFRPCLFSGTIIICEAVDAMKKTQKERNDLPTKFTEHSDGSVELLSGVRIKDIVASNLLSLTSEMNAAITNVNLGEDLLPIRFEIDKNGVTTKFEINGKKSKAPVDFEVQIGYERIGDAKVEDIPAAPGYKDVTDVDAKKFADKTGAIR